FIWQFGGLAASRSRAACSTGSRVRRRECAMTEPLPLAAAPAVTTTTDDPFALFEAWYREARASEPNDANAMALATADAQGRPSVRMVLLKGHGPEGFVFYTNFEGRKAGDILANPN